MKNVVIIGSEGLIGTELVKSLSNNNWNVIGCDITKGKTKSFYELDICSEKSITTTIDNIKKDHKVINAVINCAYPRNKNYGRTFEEVSYEDFCDNTNLHLGGYFNVLKHFLRFFKNQGHGNIISFSSIYGVIPPKFEVYKNTTMTMPVEYAAIKSAVIHLTKYCAQYVKGQNIRVNCISPGGVEDGQTQEFVKTYSSHTRTNKMLDSKDLTGPILFLLSDESRAIHGQNILVDDGFTL